MLQLAAGYVVQGEALGGINILCVALRIARRVGALNDDLAIAPGGIFDCLVRSWTVMGRSSESNSIVSFWKAIKNREPTPVIATSCKECGLDGHPSANARTVCICCHSAKAYLARYEV